MACLTTCAFAQQTTPDYVKKAQADLTTERDKCATILTALDDCLGDKTFMKSQKKVDSPDGEDLIKIIASEITADIKVQFVKDFKASEERLAEGKERLTRADERLTRTKRIKENIKANKSPQETLLSIEDLFEVEEINEVKDNPGIQEIIKYYISIGKKINHKPSSLGQKFIDEYNRINKE